jgi:hypothetical protein
MDMTMVNQERRFNNTGGGDGWYFGVSFDRKSGSILFDNKAAAYDYMWENSFTTSGAPIREVSGWELEDGRTIVMPYFKNSLHESDNSYLRTRGNASEVRFNRDWYRVSTHIHSHPEFRTITNLGLSIPNPRNPSKGSDLQMIDFLGRPIHLLYGGHLYGVDFYFGKWEIKNLGTWRRINIL